MQEELANRGQSVTRRRRRTLSVALPDRVWAPAVGLLLIAIVGGASVVFRMPMLVPSLGPSAYLVAVEPTHETVRAYNTIAGHAIGLAAGLAMVALFGAAGDPSSMATADVTAGRAAASALAVAITIVASQALHAEHAPAGATALLVALGGLRTVREWAALMLGAVLVGVVGNVVRVTSRPMPRSPFARSPEAARSTA